MEKEKFVLIGLDCNNNPSPKVVEMSSNKHLDEMKAIIGCDLVDVVEIVINETHYDCWVDDCGLISHKAPCLYVNDNLVLFGNVLVARHDSDVTIGLSDNEIEEVIEWWHRQDVLLVRWMIGLVRHK